MATTAVGQEVASHAQLVFARPPPDTPALLSFTCLGSVPSAEADVTLASGDVLRAAPGSSTAPATLALHQQIYARMRAMCEFPRESGSESWRVLNESWPRCASADNGLNTQCFPGQDPGCAVTDFSCAAGRHVAAYGTHFLPRSPEVAAADDRPGRELMPSWPCIKGGVEGKEAKRSIKCAEGPPSILWQARSGA